MLSNEAKKKLLDAKSVEEVKEVLKYDPEALADADRDWVKDACAASCKQSIEGLCWSNDRCAWWDVTYKNFWKTCPDGSEHEFDMWGNCKKCGYCPTA